MGNLGISHDPIKWVLVVFTTVSTGVKLAHVWLKFEKSAPSVWAFPDQMGLIISISSVLGTSEAVAHFDLGLGI